MKDLISSVDKKFLESQLNDTNTADVIIVFLYLMFQLAGFAGTAYLVQVYSWSPWWFLFTLVFIGSVRIKSKHKKIQ